METAVPYTVQPNDTFFKISRYYRITLDDLIESNPKVDPHQLEAGDVLYIPMSLQQIDAPIGEVQYKVKAGDSIYKLAQLNGIKIEALIKANPDINPDCLLPGQLLLIPRLNSKYVNSSLKISFDYPAVWAKINDTHYEGIDGFFRLAAVQSELSLPEISRNETCHRLYPYGSNPETTGTTLADRCACLILPSKDQPSEMKQQALVIIDCSFNWENHSKARDYIMLWADKAHIHDILGSLSFGD